MVRLGAFIAAAAQEFADAIGAPRGRYTNLLSLISEINIPSLTSPVYHYTRAQPRVSTGSPAQAHRLQLHSCAERIHSHRKSGEKLSRDKKERTGGSIDRLS